MKTIYDGVLRLLGREMDDLRTSIHAAADQLAEIEALRQAADEAIVRETGRVADDWTLPVTGYFAQARTERARLGGESHLAEARLEALRRQAIESYGRMRAMETAAEAFREDHHRAAASAEQARSDDFAGAGFARDRRRARRGSRR